MNQMLRPLIESKVRRHHGQNGLRFQIGYRKKSWAVAYRSFAGEPQPVVYSVHGAIAQHYKVDPAKLTESHASTIDYVISATGG